MSSVIDPDIIERMMSADPDEEFRQMCMCVRQGDVNKARRVYRCANLNRPLSIWDKRPPMHLAIQQGNIDMVRFLLETCDASPNATDDKGRTALHMAVLEGNEEMIQLLVNHERTDFKAVDKWGQTALHLASLCSNISAAKLLLDCCIECLQYRQRDGYTPLQIATMADNKQIASLFVSAFDSSNELKGSYRRALSEMNAAGLANLPTPPSLHSPYLYTETETRRDDHADTFEMATANADSSPPQDAQIHQEQVDEPKDKANRQSTVDFLADTKPELLDSMSASVSGTSIQNSLNLEISHSTCALMLTTIEASYSLNNAILVGSTNELQFLDTKKSDTKKSDTENFQISESPSFPEKSRINAPLESASLDQSGVPQNIDAVKHSDTYHQVVTLNDVRCSVDTLPVASALTETSDNEHSSETVPVSDAQSCIESIQPIKKQEVKELKPDCHFEQQVKTPKPDSNADQKVKELKLKLDCHVEQKVLQPNSKTDKKDLERTLDCLVEHEVKEMKPEQADQKDKEMILDCIVEQELKELKSQQADQKDNEMILDCFVEQELKELKPQQADQKDKEMILDCLVEHEAKVPNSKADKKDKKATLDGYIEQEVEELKLGSETDKKDQDLNSDCHVDQETKALKQDFETDLLPNLAIVPTSSIPSQDSTCANQGKPKASQVDFKENMAALTKTTAAIPDVGDIHKVDQVTQRSNSDTTAVHVAKNVASIETPWQSFAVRMHPALLTDDFRLKPDHGLKSHSAESTFAQNQNASPNPCQAGVFTSTSNAQKSCPEDSAEENSMTFQPDQGSIPNSCHDGVYIPASNVRQHMNLKATSVLDSSVQGRSMQKPSMQDHSYDQRSRRFDMSRTLFKLIAAMGDKKEITKVQKGILKDLVVDQEPAILAAADLFDTDGDLIEFKDTLIRLSLYR